MYSQDNIEALFSLMAESQGQHLLETGYYNGIVSQSSIWPNQLYNFKADISTLENALQAIRAAHKEKGEPSLLMSNPCVDQTEIIRILDAEAISKSQWTAMSHDLRNLPKLSNSHDLNIARVTTNDKLKTFLALVESELMQGHKLSLTMFKELLNSDKCQFFLGYVDETPVATSFIFTENSHSGIYLVATSSAFRKRGLGSAITLYTLLGAKELGSQKVDIQATEMGKPVYQKLGFKDCGVIHVHRIGEST